MKKIKFKRKFPFNYREVWALPYGYKVSMLDIVYASRPDIYWFNDRIDILEEIDTDVV